jgi:cobalamin biosynthesis protein CobT
MPEGYANPTVLNGTAGNSAPVGGRRKSLRKVSAKTIRKTLKKLGVKPKGRVVLKGGEEKEGMVAAMGGRRRKSARKSGLRKLFGY